MLGLFFNKVAALGLQLYQKRHSMQAFFCEYYEIFKLNFFYRTPPVTAPFYIGTSDECVHGSHKVTIFSDANLIRLADAVYRQPQITKCIVLLIKGNRKLIKCK